MFKDFEGKAALSTLKHFPLPQDIVPMSTREIIKAWRSQMIRCVGLKKAQNLQTAASSSIGSQSGSQFARSEIQNLLVQYELIKEQMDAILVQIEAILDRLPESKAMLSMQGVGALTVAGFLAETGDLRQLHALAANYPPSGSELNGE